MRFLAVLLALTLPAFAQIRYSPTGFTAPFISTVTNQASAQAYLGISGGGGGSITNYGGSATNLSVYSSGTTNRPFRVFATNGTTEAYFDKDGRMSLGEFGTSGNWLTVYGDVLIYRSSPTALSSAFGFFHGGSSGFQLGQSFPFGWHDGSGATVSMDTTLRRSSAGVVEVSGASAGQYRDLLLRTLYGKGGTVTASQPVLDISQTWDNAGVNFTAAKVNVTNTASGSASKLLDLQVGGVTKGYFRKDGSWYIPGRLCFTTSMEYGPQINWSGSDLVVESANLASATYRVWGGKITFDTGAGSGDVAISRNAAGVLEVNNTTAGQFRDLVTRSTFTTNLYATNITAQGYLTTQQTLAYASGTNVTVDASKSLHFVTLTNTSYFAQPSSLAVGSSFTVILKQDGTGGRAVTFDTNYWKFPGGSQPSITTNANAYSVLSCIADPYGTNVFSVSTLDIK